MQVLYNPGPDYHKKYPEQTIKNTQKKTIKNTYKKPGPRVLGLGYRVSAYGVAPSAKQGFLLLRVVFLRMRYRFRVLGLGLEFWAFSLKFSAHGVVP